jgi:hypothetical protein
VASSCTSFPVITLYNVHFVGSVEKYRKEFLTVFRDKNKNRFRDKPKHTQTFWIFIILALT